MKHNYLITNNRNVVSEISLMTEEEAREQLKSYAQNTGGRPVFMLRLEEYAEADVSFFAGNTDIGHKVKARVNRITPADIGFDDEEHLENAEDSESPEEAFNRGAFNGVASSNPAPTEGELQMRRIEPTQPPPWPPGLREVLQVATGTLTGTNRRGPFD